jgi:phosphoglycolate phosphatase-like HAD superfamily hydrolase
MAASRRAPARAVSAWLLDFDLTIAALRYVVDWKGARRELETLLRCAGAPAELFEQVPTRALPLYEAWRARFGAADKATAARASEMIERFELAGVDRAAPLEGASEALTALGKSGARLAIVTSNSSRTIERWFELHKIGAGAIPIVGRDTMLPLKPSPAMVERALALLQAKSNEACFVGDSEDDFRAAEASGIRFIGIASEPGARDRLLAAGATEVFASLAALAIHLNLAAADRSVERKEHDARTVRR